MRDTGRCARPAAHPHVYLPTGVARHDLSLGIVCREALNRPELQCELQEPQEPQ